MTLKYYFVVRPLWRNSFSAAHGRELPITTTIKVVPFQQRSDQVGPARVIKLTGLRRICAVERLSVIFYLSYVIPALRQTQDRPCFARVGIQYDASEPGSRPSPG